MSLYVAFMAVFTLSGCNIVGFLASPGPFEKKIPPQYDLQAQQDRKILILIDCPRSSEVDYDVKKKLIAGFELYLRSQMDIEPANFVSNPSGLDQALNHDPVKMAQELGVGYVLLVQVDQYGLSPLNSAKYFTGQMISRAVLMDADLNMAVWPKEPGGKIVHIGVDLETKGRDIALTRLVSGTTHCILRYLYPCEKLKYKNSDEVYTLQEAFEMETY